ncbi:hypothetical protein FHR37_003799 [Actinopolymorpha cephalotaxi]|uniref:Uncharacterized protein n=1 Tax=Actinopolymorpha cephalotaxi TaxID=504797 RepID=A0ABX2S5Q3_9ACTN|nr:hypothetical protein [Actinopolymorpha cephalotaxi]
MVEVVPFTHLPQLCAQIDEQHAPFDETGELTDFDVGHVRTAGSGLGGDEQLVVHLRERQDEPVDLEVRILLFLVPLERFLLPRDARVGECPEIEDLLRPPILVRRLPATTQNGAAGNGGSSPYSTFEQCPSGQGRHLHQPFESAEPYRPTT